MSKSSYLENESSSKSINATLHEKSQFARRYRLNRSYMASLKSENLLQNHFIEAGLRTWSHKPPDDIHWGWESPECQLRGHFPGHWLAAAARIYHQTGDMELKGKADYIVSRLAECQLENGGEWLGSIPTTYMDWISRGKKVWAPQYTLHKTWMGLVDMARYAENDQALKLADRWADWYCRWTDSFSREQLDDILDFETGGMLEVWADLLDLTGDKKYLSLIERFDRPRLFEPLLAGKDVLTNRHANTTIPEIHGAARVYEVTGNERYRNIVEHYWQQAVTERGFFATGGQTSNEIWTGKHQQSTRLSPYNQEHCVVYNMIRLADFLLRWSGDVKYADYIERNIYNGLFAQQHLKTGMVAYYLPLHGGAKIKWGTPTHDFWCCHGTLVQASQLYAELAFYETKQGLMVSQAIPASCQWQYKGSELSVSQMVKVDRRSVTNPDDDLVILDIKADKAVECDIQVRIPWWTTQATVKINGQAYEHASGPSSWLTICKQWQNDTIEITFRRKLTLCATDDRPDLAAYMYGPLVLAALTDKEIRLAGGAVPDQVLRRFDDDYFDDVNYFTVGQAENCQVVPLYTVLDHQYAVYFQIE